MLRKLVALLLIAMLGCSALSGCYQMGKAAGKTEKGMKEGAQDMEEGYHEGKSD